MFSKALWWHVCVTLCSVALLCSVPAHAFVIDFENVVPTNTEDPVVVDGFEFDYIDNNGWAISDVDGVTNTLGNATIFITCRDTGDADCAITMTPVNGLPFGLTQFDGADGMLGVGGRTIQVTGSLQGGGTVIETFTTVADTFTTYTTNAMTDLMSVEFRGFGPGDDGIAFDNINIVPEPATSALVVAMCGMACGRRRRL